MASFRYFVVSHEGQWKITCDGQYYGPYATAGDALRVGIVAANASGEAGHDSEVLVEGDDKLFHPKWTYGGDAFVPFNARLKN